MNKALLDTDILSEVAKGIDQNVARNASAYRQAHRFLKLSVISVMEVIQGYSASGDQAESRPSAMPSLSRKSSHSTRLPLTWQGRSLAIWTAPASQLAAATR